jgi:HK97 family phage major capsid protein
MDVNDLRRERAALVKDGRSLLEAVEAKDRALTDEEKRTDDARADKIAALGVKIDEIERDDEYPIGTVISRMDLGTGTGRDEYGYREVRADERFERPGSYPKINGVKQEDIDLGRALRGLLTGDWTNADAERRALAGNTDTAGGFLLPDLLSDQIIDHLRDASVLSQAGVRTLDMKDRVYGIPRAVSDVTAYWRSENVKVTESEPSFARADLQPHTCAALARISIELFQDSRGVGDAVTRSIAGALALALDYAGLEGSGAGQPQGLLNTSGVTKQTSFGALSWDGLINQGLVLEGVI